MCAPWLHTLACKIPYQPNPRNVDRRARADSGGEGVETPLMAAQVFRAEEEANFIKALDAELARLISFFMRKVGQ